MPNTDTAERTTAIVDEGSDAPLRASWDRFLASLDQARVSLESTNRYKGTRQHRAKAYHALIEASAMAYNFSVAPRLHRPRIHVNTGWQTDIYTVGQNGPDFHYGHVFLDGRQTYRLSGNRNESIFILAQVHSHMMGHPDAIQIGNHDFSKFDFAEDGSFEVTISATPAAGNWIALDARSRYQWILLRSATGDFHAKHASYALERTSEIPEEYYYDEEFDEAAVAERIDLAAGCVQYLIDDFSVDLYRQYVKNAGDLNTFSLLPGTITSQVGNPLAMYAMAIFRLDNDDEALLIEMDDVPKTAAYWSYQLGDVWSRALEFVLHQSTINMHHAKLDDDGIFRAIVSRRDPGIANWLDTTGRVEGTVVFRNYRSETRPVPKARKIRFDEIDAVLPANTARVTPEERKAILEDRRAAFLALHGE